VTVAVAVAVAVAKTAAGRIEYLSLPVLEAVAFGETTPMYRMADSWTSGRFPSGPLYRYHRLPAC
jgi:hypothetical protein